MYSYDISIKESSIKDKYNYEGLITSLLLYAYHIHAYIFHGNFVKFAGL